MFVLVRVRVPNGPSPCVLSSAAKATATQMTNTSSSSFSMQATKLTPVTLYHTRKMIDPDFSTNLAICLDVLYHISWENGTVFSHFLAVLPYLLTCNTQ